MRSGLVRCLDGGGAVESRCVWRSVDVTWLMEGPGEAEEEWWAPSGLLWRQGFRYFMVWGCPWNGVIQESCWKAAVWYIQWGVVPEGTLDRDCLPGEGIHTEMERRAAPEAFLKSSAGFSQYLSWRVWELWHHLCGICGFSCILVLCNKLDTKFNRDTASYTPQVTKCGGQLIRTVYALSRWWVCAWNGDTTVFSK